MCYTFRWRNNESEVKAMREGIHPDYQDARVTCVCGESFTTKSTKKEIKVEVCSKCHPFFTGQRQKTASSGGRIERFNKKYNMKTEDE